MLSVFVASCSYVAPHAAAVSRRTAHANMLSYNNALGGTDIAVHDVLYEEDHLLLLEQIAAVETEKKPGCASCCRKCGAACPGASRSRTPKMSFGEYDAFLREIDDREMNRAERRTAFAAAEAALADLAQDADEVAVAVPTRLPSLGEAHRIELEQLTALASLVVSGVFAEQLAVLGRRHFL